MVAGVLIPAACETQRPPTPAAESFRPTTAQVSSPTASPTASGGGSRSELVAAVDSYVEARNGSDLSAYRASICRSVRDSPAGQSPPPAIDVVVDRVGNVRVDRRTAVVTVDLRYVVGQSGSTQTIGPFPGIEWTFALEGGAWRQCSPPAFRSRGSG